MCAAASRRHKTEVKELFHIWIFIGDIVEWFSTPVWYAGNPSSSLGISTYTNWTCSSEAEQAAVNRQVGDFEIPQVRKIESKVTIGWLSTAVTRQAQKGGRFDSYYSHKNRFGKLKIQIYIYDIKTGMKWCRLLM